MLIYLTSGLFLGWSLGANDAANVFGTAVGSRMIRFAAAAWICSIFVILGAVIGGAGAAHGLGKLGSVNALAGSFTVALAAALTVYWMTKAGLPVSTTQAIVGGIVGWNLFSGSVTDPAELLRIVGTWIACPILGALFAAILYRLTVAVLRRWRPHLLQRDFYTRWGLILAGAFGAYSLGANNIANVVGVFVDSSPFRDLALGPMLTVSGVQQLFFFGAVAISVGVFTYSRRVMFTVGRSLMPLNPVAAWVVVVSHSLVLFVFSSSRLQAALMNLGLPPVPLIPVSSSQAIIGAVLGVAITQGRGKSLRQVRWGVLLKVASGWFSTPLLAALLTYLLLFFMQNVFQKQVFQPVYYQLSESALTRLEKHGIEIRPLEDLAQRQVSGSAEFLSQMRRRIPLDRQQQQFVLSVCKLEPLKLSRQKMAQLDARHFSRPQFRALQRLVDRRFHHRWELADALAEEDDSWRLPGDADVDRFHNRQDSAAFDHLVQFFSEPPEDGAL